MIKKLITQNCHTNTLEKIDALQEALLQTSLAESIVESSWVVVEEKLVEEGNYIGEHIPVEVENLLVLGDMQQTLLAVVEEDKRLVGKH